MAQTVTTELGSFLRAKRDATRSETAGPPPGVQRRVPGLRRAEVATLAGISVEYYVKLEQGRERHPSKNVVDALATAFELDHEEREHLGRLAGWGAGAADRAVQTPISPSLQQLLDSWPEHPALVLAPSRDVVARNALADALHRHLTIRDNLALMIFLDPAARNFYTDYDRACHSVVANLRNAQGRFPGDERIATVIGELGVSAQFRRLWSARSVFRKAHDSKTVRHADVGTIELSFESFYLPGDSGQELVVYQAQPGSRSARALRQLGSPNAQATPERHP